MRLDPKFQPLLQAQLKLWQGSAELWQNQAAHWAELHLQLLRNGLDESRQESLQWFDAADAQRRGLLPAEQLWQQAHQALAAAQTLAQNAINQQTTLSTESQQLLADWQQATAEALSAAHDAMPLSAALKFFLPAAEPARKGGAA